MVPLVVMAWALLGTLFLFVDVASHRLETGSSLLLQQETIGVASAAAGEIVWQETLPSFKNFPTGMPSMSAPLLVLDSEGDVQKIYVMVSAEESFQVTFGLAALNATSGSTSAQWQWPGGMNNFGTSGGTVPLAINPRSEGEVYYLASSDSICSGYSSLEKLPPPGPAQASGLPQVTELQKTWPCRTAAGQFQGPTSCLGLGSPCSRGAIAYASGPTDSPKLSVEHLAEPITNPSNWYVPLEDLLPGYAGAIGQHRTSIPAWSEDCQTVYFATDKTALGLFGSGSGLGSNKTWTMDWQTGYTVAASSNLTPLGTDSVCVLAWLGSTKYEPGSTDNYKLKVKCVGGVSYEALMRNSSDFYFSGYNLAPAASTARPGSLYVSDGSSAIYHYDSEGTQVWKAQIAPPSAQAGWHVSPPSVSLDGTEVYTCAGNPGGRLYALNASSGEQIWNKFVGGLETCFVAAADMKVLSSQTKWQVVSDTYGCNPRTYRSLWSWSGVSVTDAKRACEALGPEVCAGVGRAGPPAPLPDGPWDISNNEPVSYLYLRKAGISALYYPNQPADAVGSFVVGQNALAADESLTSGYCYAYIDSVEERNRVVIASGLGGRVVAVSSGASQRHSTTYSCPTPSPTTAPPTSGPPTSGRRSTSPFDTLSHDQPCKIGAGLVPMKPTNMTGMQLEAACTNAGSCVCRGYSHSEADGPVLLMTPVAATATWSQWASVVKVGVPFSPDAGLVEVDSTASPDPTHQFCVAGPSCELTFIDAPCPTKAFWHMGPSAKVAFSVTLAQMKNFTHDPAFLPDYGGICRDLCILSADNGAGCGGFLITADGGCAILVKSSVNASETFFECLDGKGGQPHYDGSLAGVGQLAADIPGLANSSFPSFVSNDHRMPHGGGEQSMPLCSLALTYHAGTAVESGVINQMAHSFANPDMQCGAFLVPTVDGAASMAAKTRVEPASGKRCLYTSVGSTIAVGEVVSEGVYGDTTYFEVMSAVPGEPCATACTAAPEEKSPSSASISWQQLPKAYDISNPVYLGGVLIFEDSSISEHSSLGALEAVRASTGEHLWTVSNLALSDYYILYLDVFAPVPGVGMVYLAEVAGPTSAFELRVNNVGDGSLVASYELPGAFGINAKGAGMSLCDFSLLIPCAPSVSNAFADFLRVDLAKLNTSNTPLDSMAWIGNGKATPAYVGSVKTLQNEYQELPPTPMTFTTLSTTKPCNLGEGALNYDGSLSAAYLQSKCEELGSAVCRGVAITAYGGSGGTNSWILIKPGEAATAGAKSIGWGATVHPGSTNGDAAGAQQVVVTANTGSKYGGFCYAVTDTESASRYPCDQQWSYYFDDTSESEAECRAACNAQNLCAGYNWYDITIPASYPQYSCYDTDQICHTFSATKLDFCPRSVSGPNPESEYAKERCQRWRETWFEEYLPQGKSEAAIFCQSAWGPGHHNFTESACPADKRRKGCNLYTLGPVPNGTATFSLSRASPGVSGWLASAAELNVSNVALNATANDTIACFRRLEITQGAATEQIVAAAKPTYGATCETAVVPVLSGSSELDIVHLNTTSGSTESFSPPLGGGEDATVESVSSLTRIPGSAGSRACFTYYTTTHHNVWCGKIDPHNSGPHDSWYSKTSTLPPPQRRIEPPALISPSIMDSATVFVTDPYIQNINGFATASGALQFSASNVLSHLSPPTFTVEDSGALMFVGGVEKGSSSPSLVCINVSTGIVEWSIALDNSALSGPVTLGKDGKVFAATSFGNLFAVQPPLQDVSKVLERVEESNAACKALLIDAGCNSTRSSPLEDEKRLKCPSLLLDCQEKYKLANAGLLDAAQGRVVGVPDSRGRYPFSSATAAFGAGSLVEVHESLRRRGSSSHAYVASGGEDLGLKAEAQPFFNSLYGVVERVWHAVTPHWDGPSASCLFGKAFGCGAVPITRSINMGTEQAKHRNGNILGASTAYDCYSEYSRLLLKAARWCNNDDPASSTPLSPRPPDTPTSIMSIDGSPMTCGSSPIASIAYLCSVQMAKLYQELGNVKCPAIVDDPMGKVAPIVGADAMISVCKLAETPRQPDCVCPEVHELLPPPPPPLEAITQVFMCGGAVEQPKALENMRREVFSQGYPFLQQGGCPNPEVCLEFCEQNCDLTQQPTGAPTPPPLRLSPKVSWAPTRSPVRFSSLIEEEGAGFPASTRPQASSQTQTKAGLETPLPFRRDEVTCMSAIPGAGFEPFQANGLAYAGKNGQWVSWIQYDARESMIFVVVGRPLLGDNTGVGEAKMVLKYWCKRSKNSKRGKMYAAKHSGHFAELQTFCRDGNIAALTRGISYVIAARGFSRWKTGAVLTTAPWSVVGVVRFQKIEGPATPRQTPGSSQSGHSSAASGQSLTDHVFVDVSNRRIQQGGEGFGPGTPYWPSIAASCATIASVSNETVAALYFGSGTSTSLLKKLSSQADGYAASKAAFAKAASYWSIYYEGTVTLQINDYSKCCKGGSLLQRGALSARDRQLEKSRSRRRNRRRRGRGRGRRSTLNALVCSCVGGDDVFIPMSQTSTERTIAAGRQVVVLTEPTTAVGSTHCKIPQGAWGAYQNYVYPKLIDEDGTIVAKLLGQFLPTFMTILGNQLDDFEPLMVREDSFRRCSTCLLYDQPIFDVSLYEQTMPLGKTFVPVNFRAAWGWTTFQRWYNPTQNPFGTTRPSCSYAKESAQRFNELLGRQRYPGGQYGDDGCFNFDRPPTGNPWSENMFEQISCFGSLTLVLVDVDKNLIQTRQAELSCAKASQINPTTHQFYGLEQDIYSEGFCQGEHAIPLYNEALIEALLELQKRYETSLRSTGKKLKILLLTSYGPQNLYDILQDPSICSMNILRTKVLEHLQSKGLRVDDSSIITDLDVMFNANIPTGPDSSWLDVESSLYPWTNADVEDAVWSTDMVKTRTREFYPINPFTQYVLLPLERKVIKTTNENSIRGWASRGKGPPKAGSETPEEKLARSKANFQSWLDWSSPGKGLLDSPVDSSNPSSPSYLSGEAHLREQWQAWKVKSPSLNPYSLGTGTPASTEPIDEGTIVGKREMLQMLINFFGRDAIARMQPGLNPTGPSPLVRKDTIPAQVALRKTLQGTIDQILMHGYCVYGSGTNSFKGPCPINYTPRGPVSHVIAFDDELSVLQGLSKTVQSLNLHAGTPVPRDIWTSASPTSISFLAIPNPAEALWDVSNKFTDDHIEPVSSARSAPPTAPEDLPLTNAYLRIIQGFGGPLPPRPRSRRSSDDTWAEELIDFSDLEQPLPPPPAAAAAAAPIFFETGCANLGCDSQIMGYFQFPAGLPLPTPYKVNSCDGTACNGIASVVTQFQSCKTRCIQDSYCSLFSATSSKKSGITTFTCSLFSATLSKVTSTCSATGSPALLGSAKTGTSFGEPSRSPPPGLGPHDGDLVEIRRASALRGGPPGGHDDPTDPLCAPPDGAPPAEIGTATSIRDVGAAGAAAFRNAGSLDVRVTFVRHAVSCANVLKEALSDSVNYLRATMAPDAEICDAGFAQAVEMRHAVFEAHQGDWNFDYVLVSPLRRTIQTALAGLPATSVRGAKQGDVVTMHIAPSVGEQRSKYACGNDLDNGCSSLEDTKSFFCGMGTLGRTCTVDFGGTSDGEWRKAFQYVDPKGSSGKCDTIIGPYDTVGSAPTVTLDFEDYPPVPKGYQGGSVEEFLEALQEKYIPDAAVAQGGGPDSVNIIVFTHSHTMTKLLEKLKPELDPKDNCLKCSKCCQGAKVKPENTAVFTVPFRYSPTAVPLTGSSKVTKLLFDDSSEDGNILTYRGFFPKGGPKGDLAEAGKVAPGYNNDPITYKFTNGKCCACIGLGKYKRPSTHTIGGDPVPCYYARCSYGDNADSVRGTCWYFPALRIESNLQSYVLQEAKPISTGEDPCGDPESGPVQENEDAALLQVGAPPGHVQMGDQCYQYRAACTKPKCALNSGPFRVSNLLALLRTYNNPTLQNGEFTYLQNGALRSASFVAADGSTSTFNNVHIATSATGCTETYTCNIAGARINTQRYDNMCGFADAAGIQAAATAFTSGAAIRNLDSLRITIVCERNSNVIGFRVNCQCERTLQWCQAAGAAAQQQQQQGQRSCMIM